MFKKLLRYDFISIYKFWCIAAVSVFALTLLGGGSMSLFTSARSYPIPLTLLFVFVTTFTFIGYVVFSILSFILIYRRFYMNFFTDEGYLTFTLPVTCTQHLNTKLIFCAVTTFATTLVIVLNFFILLEIGIADFHFFQKMLKGLADLLSQLWDTAGIFMVIGAVEILVIVILTSIMSCLLIFCCITFGSIIAKKAKLLAAIGIYYLVSGVYSFAVQIFNVLGISSITLWMDHFPGSAQAPMFCLLALGVLLFIATLCSLLYNLEHWMLDRKLNLP